MSFNRLIIETSNGTALLVLDLPEEVFSRTAFIHFERYEGDIHRMDVTQHARLIDDAYTTSQEDLGISPVQTNPSPTPPPADNHLRPALPERDRTEPTRECPNSMCKMPNPLRYDRCTSCETPFPPVTEE